MLLRRAAPVPPACSSASRPYYEMGSNVSRLAKLRSMWCIRPPTGAHAEGGERPNTMSTQPEDHPILHKTRELCQTVLGDPEVVALRGKINAFMADAQLCRQYE